MIPSKSQDTFLLQQGEFPGKGASVHAEIVGQLLAVEGKVERSAALADGFVGKIGEQLVPKRTAGHVLDLFCQHQVFPGKDCDKILDQTLMKRAGLTAGVEQIADIQKQDFTVFCRNYAHLQRASGAGIRFGEELSGFRFPEDGPVSPEIFLNNMHLSRQHKTHERKNIPMAADELVFLTGSVSVGETGEDGRNFFRHHLVKKGRG